MSNFKNFKNYKNLFFLKYWLSKTCEILLSIKNILFER